MRVALLFAALLFTTMLTVASAGDCKQAQDSSACIQTPNCSWCGEPGSHGYNGTCICDTCVCEHDSSCRADLQRTVICSGQGSCNSGECVCYERANIDQIVSGKYCDCTNFLCDRHDGQLCSGPTHGTCICDKCVCKPGWGGDSCECTNSTQDCMNPDTNEVCSNNGECECNQCRCYRNEGGRYSGKWCEDCPTCTGKCLLYKPCVQCQVFGTGDLDEQQCFDNCNLFKSTQVDVAAAEEGEALCSFFDENDCRFTFVYGYDVYRQPAVRVGTNLECPPGLTSGGTISRSVVWTTIVAALWSSCRRLPFSNRVR